jgi:large repetitive protein
MRTSFIRPGLIAGLLALGVASPVHAQTLGFGETLEQVVTAVRGGSRGLSIDSSRLTPGALASTLSPRNATGAFYHVRDLIEYDIYSGTMRGARGTLFTRAGNSLDRSLLLGALLDEFNVEWRLAHGTLTDEAATRLVNLATRPGEWTGTILPANVTQYDASMDVRHRNLARDHFWVEAMVGGEWTAMDTSDPALEPGATLTTATETFAEEAIPSADVQQMHFGLYYTTNGTNGGEVLSLDMPTAEVAFRNIGLHLQQGANQTFQPTLTMGDTVVEGTPIQAGGLQRVWVELYFRQGGLDHRVVRELFSADSTFDLFTAEQSVYSFLLLPGFVGPDYFRAVISTIWEDFSDSAASLEAAFDADVRNSVPGQAAGSSLSSAYAARLSDLLGVAGLTFANASDELALRVGMMLGVRPFYDRPRVLIAGVTRQGDDLAFQLDLRSNGIDALPYDDVPWGATYAFQAIRGRVDSELEGVLLEALTANDVLHTPEFMQTARTEGASLRTIHLGNVSRLSGSEYSAEAQRRLTAEVTNQGFVAVAPSRPITFGGSSFIHWWRIEPSTGAILGVSEAGLHPSFSVLTGRTEPDANSTDPTTLGDRIMQAVLAGVQTSFSVAQGSTSWENLVCTARCESLEMSFLLCGGGRPAFDDVLDQCLASTALVSSSLIGQNVTCASQVQNYVCGAEVFDAVSTRLIQLNASQAYLGPWDALAPLSMSNCACD